MQESSSMYTITPIIWEIYESLIFKKTESFKTLEENNYYSFGLKHSGYNENNLQLVYKYKFQGQERQDDLSLNWDSFKWRNYDFTIGRFFNIDPLTEKYPNFSQKYKIIR